MVVQNVGSVCNYYTGARNHILPSSSGPPQNVYSPDISVHPESKSHDRAKLMNLSQSCKLFFAASNDVVIVNHKPGVCKVEVICNTIAGLLNVRVTKPGAKSLIIMGIYLHPGIKSRVAAVITCRQVREWHKLLSRTYPGECILLCGDTNARLGTLIPGRFSDDQMTLGHHTVLSELLKDLNYSPLHGRSALTPGTYTSRSVDEKRQGRSEVDYIFAHTGLDTSSYSLYDHQSFDDIEGEGALTHVAIGAVIRLPRLPRNGAPQPPTEEPHPKPSVVPDWDSLDQYSEAAETLRAELESGSIRDAIGADAKLKALQAALSKARALHLDPQSEEQVEVDADREAPCRPNRRDRHVFYKGTRLPHHLAVLHEHARAIRLAARRAKRSGQSVAEKTLFQEFHAARNKAREATRTYWRLSESSLFRRLEHARVHNAHKLYRMIDKLCPLAGTGFSSFSPAAASADAENEAQNFLASFKEILCGTKPVPDASSDAFWLQFLPQGVGGDALRVRPTWQEIMLVVFPVHKCMGNESWHTCIGAGADCVLCSHERVNINSWDGSPDSPECEAPNLSPHLHSSVAPGPDGLPPEDIMWLRPKDLKARFPFRKLFCENIADVLGAIWDEGVIPEFANYRTTPVPKNAKPGVHVDVSDSDNYRPITCGNVLAKILGLVIARRLMHWSVAQDHPLISPSQIGFMQLKGAEEHVFSLLELAKSRWRVGSPIYALFVDLRKAYDTVHPKALWAVLRHMGVPEIIVALLEDWSMKRITTMVRNGVASEPWHMSMGVGQGDVLSPLLFNFFIESLGRYVASRPGFSGVTIGGSSGPGSITVKLLKYADDVFNAANSPEELQIVLNATVAWCDAWGMQLGLGGKKTEAMAFIPPNHPRLDILLPRLTVKGVEVAWVSEYRYLGYTVRSDLRDDGALTSMSSKLAGQWQRYFNSTAAILHHSPAFSLQVFKTTVSGATNYLLAFANPAGAAKKLDTLSLRVARKALRMSDRKGDLACNAMVWGESRLPRGEAILARERTRFMLKMRKSPFRASDIATRIFFILSASADSDRLPLWHTAKSLTHRMLRLESVGIADGTIPPVILLHTQFKDCAKAAAIVSRRVGLHIWQRESRAVLMKNPLLPSSDVLRPPSSERGMAAYLNDFYRFPLFAAGTNKYTTVLASRGPGCCGGLLSQVSRMPQLVRRMRALAAVRRGRKGMFDAPLAVSGRTYSERMDLDVLEADDLGIESLESNKARGKRIGQEHRVEMKLLVPCC